VFPTTIFPFPAPSVIDFSPVILKKIDYVTFPFFSLSSYSIFIEYPSLITNLEKIGTYKSLRDKLTYPLYFSVFNSIKSALN
jgi:hypothetical protein